ncbi:HMG box family protein [Trichomonas vaginalis G3]|uniref:HMG box family protein n=1 Tax=Trichomonas vaginalis (strain ATCC PRA-98 / G3) TaxID=412133 RepID=A2FA38_TRIV3|nr:positive regulation of mesenchymal stem cell differentiation protein family [Trichomonas vaginalis G3]EAX98246.1 HMG box family protein [Trichomonas vaginalis G3]KAI5543387.1 positive regulation of mesenchymal stem cell differentiation protein family [Trichomonas vaginalis G3]|eukprot:XP_001311176.1 HMG box family protein [Trichomonas vaginalis G3]
MDDLTPISIQGMPNYGELNLENPAMSNLPQAEKLKIKRPPNAFLLFCRDKRQAARGENPDLKNVDVSQVLAEQWKNLADTEKLYYKALAAEQQKLFKEENPDYRYEKAKAKQLMNKMKLRPEFKQITNVLDVKTLLAMSVEDVKAYMLYLSSQVLPTANQATEQIQQNFQLDNFQANQQQLPPL